MDLRLSVDDRALQRRAREFTDEVLVPLEDECEEHDGLTPERHEAAKRAVLAWGFNGINHAIAHLSEKQPEVQRPATTSRSGQALHNSGQKAAAPPETSQ